MGEAAAAVRAEVATTENGGGIASAVFLYAFLVRCLKMEYI